MIRLFLAITSLIFTSCCSPYYATDPLYLDRIDITSDCPLKPCKGTDTDCPGPRPWTNIEFDIGRKGNALKIGQYFHGYSENYMISGGGNWVKQGIKDNGFSLDFQIGFLEKNDRFTLFPGIEYIRFNKNGNSQSITPSISYLIPYKPLTAFQFKAGYNIGLENNNYSGFFFGVKTQFPIAQFLD
jgi:hypothetical protein